MVAVWSKIPKFSKKFQKTAKIPLTMVKSGCIIISILIVFPIEAEKSDKEEKHMFKGMVEHQLDDKNRLRIPSKFKKELTGENGEKSYSFFRGMNRCICVMADDELDDTIASISEEAISESNQASAMFFSSIFSAEEDAQGRVVLPAMLKKMAGIQKDIVTLGRGKRLEIWAAEKYYEYLEGVDYDSELKKLGI